VPKYSYSLNQWGYFISLPRWKVSEKAQWKTPTIVASCLDVAFVITLLVFFSIGGLPAKRMSNPFLLRHAKSIAFRTLHLTSHWHTVCWQTKWDKKRSRCVSSICGYGSAVSREVIPKISTKLQWIYLETEQRMIWQDDPICHSPGSRTQTDTP